MTRSFCIPPAFPFGRLKELPFHLKLREAVVTTSKNKGLIFHTQSQAMPCIVNDSSQVVCQNFEGPEVKRVQHRAQPRRRGEPLHAHANIINNQVREQQVEEMP